jgi:hypothetical protein
VELATAMRQAAGVQIITRRCGCAVAGLKLGRGTCAGPCTELGVLGWQLACRSSRAGAGVLVLVLSRGSRDVPCSGVGWQLSCRSSRAGAGVLRQGLAGAWQLCRVGLGGAGEGTVGRDQQPLGSGKSLRTHQEQLQQHGAAGMRDDPEQFDTTHCDKHKTKRSQQPACLPADQVLKHH